MKILLITLSSYSGMIHYTSQLANHLSKTDDVVVIGPEGFEKKNFNNKIKLLELKLGNNIKNFFINTILLNRPLKFLNTIYNEDPDVIHCIELQLWLSIFLPFLNKYPIVSTIHDVKPHLGARGFDEIMARYLQVKFSNAIFVHGEKAKIELNSSKCHVIPHGDYSFFLDYKNKNIHEEKAILFFGRIEDYKGLVYLIKAMNLISQKFKNYKLIIAGTGDFKKYYKLTSNSKLFEIHNQYIPDREVPILFQRAQIVVLPYIESTQTGIIPIAYAFKKPVIVTNVGSVPEVVINNKTGLIVPPKNSKALSDAIIYLLENENLCHEMGKNAYEYMKDYLSWDGIIKKIKKVYSDLGVSNGSK